jgi:hypothetical protein
MGNVNNKTKKGLKSLNKDSNSEKKRQTKNNKINTEFKEEKEKKEENDKKNLKSLSANKLIKISYENNHEEVYPNSLDTNFSSTKSNTNEVIEEEEELEENSSNEGSEEEEMEKNEEFKNKELLITNNIKKVFIDSKRNNSSSDVQLDETNEENKNLEDIKRERDLSISTFDYELNIFRDSEAVRESYISKLISMKVWNPGMKPKYHNSLIIFDWDDTLLPTTFLTPKGTFSEDIQLSPSDYKKMQQIANYVYDILKESIEKGDVYIITNAGINWVQFSANLFYPNISELLKKIKIISARGEYEKSFPGNLRQWKIQAFLNLLKNVDNKLVTNIICIGDSLFEMEAGRILASNFKEAFIKTIKFREAPKLDELLKQLKLVSQQFGAVYSSIKNLTIRIERKKKEK